VAIICLKIAFGERVRLNKRVHFSITEFPGTSNDIEIYAGAYLWYVSLRRINRSLFYTINLIENQTLISFYSSTQNRQK